MVELRMRSSAGVAVAVVIATAAGACGLDLQGTAPALDGGGAAGDASTPVDAAADAQVPSLVGSSCAGFTSLAGYSACFDFDDGLIPAGTKTVAFEGDVTIAASDASAPSLLLTRTTAPIALSHSASLYKTFAFPAPLLASSPAIKIAMSFDLRVDGLVFTVPSDDSPFIALASVALGGSKILAFAMAPKDKKADATPVAFLTVFDNGKVTQVLVLDRTPAVGVWTHIDLSMLVTLGSASTDIAYDGLEIATGYEYKPAGTVGTDPWSFAVGHTSGPPQGVVTTSHDNVRIEIFR
ncbi:MAG: hypothetical protein JWM74_3259 [Myxococcaceae bacterium]|nr:hypothetical protein [Myxococcaceae bacterium]